MNRVADDLYHTFLVGPVWSALVNRERALLATANGAAVTMQQVVNW
jgi:hypothetical protein